MGWGTGGSQICGHLVTVACTRNAGRSLIADAVNKLDLKSVRRWWEDGRFGEWDDGMTG